MSTGLHATNCFSRRFIHLSFLYHPLDVSGSNHFGLMESQILDVDNNLVSIGVFKGVKFMFALNLINKKFQ